MSTTPTSSLSSGLIPLSPNRSPSYRSSGFNSRGVLGVQLSLLAGGSLGGSFLNEAPEDESEARVSHISPQESHTNVSVDQSQGDPQEPQVPQPEQSAVEIQTSILPDQEPAEVAIDHMSDVPLDVSSVEHEPSAEVDMPSTPLVEEEEEEEEGAQSTGYSLSSGLVPLSFNPFSHLQQRRQTALELGAGLDLLLGEEEETHFPKKKKKKRKQVLHAIINSFV
jgi:hypothetical protein